MDADGIDVLAEEMLKTSLDCVGWFMMVAATGRCAARAVALLGGTRVLSTPSLPGSAASTCVPGSAASTCVPGSAASIGLPGRPTALPSMPGGEKPLRLWRAAAPAFAQCAAVAACVATACEVAVCALGAALYNALTARGARDASAAAPLPLVLLVMVLRIVVGEAIARVERRMTAVAAVRGAAASAATAARTTHQAAQARARWLLDGDGGSSVAAADPESPPQAAPSLSTRVHALLFFPRPVPLHATVARRRDSEHAPSGGGGGGGGVGGSVGDGDGQHAGRFVEFARLGGMAAALLSLALLFALTSS